MPSDPLPFTVDEILARLSAEVQRLERRSAELRAAPPAPELAIPLLGEQEQLKKFEQLLARTLAAARPRGWLAKLVYWLIPSQVPHNLLVIEILTNLFETYRTLTYECSDMRRTILIYREQLEEGVEARIEEKLALGVKRDFEFLQQATNARVTELENRLQTVQAELLHERQLLRAELAILSSQTSRSSEARPEADAWSRKETDAFYLDFENRFRGSRENVKSKLQNWLVYLDPVLAQPELGGVLDIGCGRGEWLELLRAQGVKARGIDNNGCMVDFCQRLGLPAEPTEALQHLRALPADSLRLVTGFHIIEHFPFRELRDLLGAVLRVLAPGGIALFETPNPSNVTVGSHTFYRDHSHMRPLPPASTGFLFEYLGFAQVEIVEMNPCSLKEHLPTAGNVCAERFNQLFYGAQDYGIIARKPGARTSAENAP